jgi:hypothetical protein
VLPAHFFRFFKILPMAKTAPKTPDTETPEVVKLKCDDLGIESQDFTPKHAKELLAFQESKGYDHWQPVDAAQTSTDNA